MHKEKNVSKLQPFLCIIFSKKYFLMETIIIIIMANIVCKSWNRVKLLPKESIFFVKRLGIAYSWYFNLFPPKGVWVWIPQQQIIFLWVPHGVEVERWLCNPRVSGSIPGAGNLEKLFIWMHGLTQKTNSNRVIEFFQLT